MGSLLKLLIFLVVMGFIALVVYAYIGDLTPERSDVSQPVTLDVD